MPTNGKASSKLYLIIPSVIITNINALLTTKCHVSSGPFPVELLGGIGAIKYLRDIFSNIF
jgi:hypothetical protein